MSIPRVTYVGRETTSKLFKLATNPGVPLHLADFEISGKDGSALAETVLMLSVAADNVCEVFVVRNGYEETDLCWLAPNEDDLVARWQALSSDESFVPIKELK